MHVAFFSGDSTSHRHHNLKKKLQIKIAALNGFLVVVLDRYLLESHIEYWFFTEKLEDHPQRGVFSHRIMPCEIFLIHSDWNHTFE